MDKLVSPNQQLYDAIREDDAKTIRHLLENGADPNLPNEHGTTPLMQAVNRPVPPGNEQRLNDRTECVRALLENGADVNLQNAIGYTVLDYAVQHDLSECIRLLLEHGADPNRFAPEEFGPPATPLLRAAGNGLLNNVRCLVEYGKADVTVQDHFNRTPLLVSAQDAPDVTRYLAPYSLRLQQDLQAHLQQELSGPGVFMIDDQAKDFLEYLVCYCDSDYDPELVNFMYDTETLRRDVLNRAYAFTSEEVRKLKDSLQQSSPLL